MPKLMRKSYLCQSQKTKSYMPLYLYYYFKTINFTVSLFLFFSKTNQSCFYVMFQLVFTSCFELVYSVNFIHHYWFWYFLSIYRLEVINSWNIYSVFQRLSECNFFLELFPHTPNLLLPFDYCFTKKWCTQAKSWMSVKLLFLCAICWKNVLYLGSDDVH